MKKLFVVTSDPTTTEQDRAFYEWFEPRLNWWHWLGQTWLFVDEAGEYSSQTIRDEFSKSCPGVHVMVIEITGDNTWYGFGPRSATDETKNMFTWLQENWRI